VEWVPSVGARVKGFTTGRTDTPSDPTGHFGTYRLLQSRGPVRPGRRGNRSGGWQNDLAGANRFTGQGRSPCSTLSFTWGTYPVNIPQRNGVLPAGETAGGGTKVNSSSESSSLGANDKMVQCIAYPVQLGHDQRFIAVGTHGFTPA